MEIHSLSKHRLEALQHQVRAELQRRYKHSGTPKYGSLDKAFSQAEFSTFLENVRHPKAKVIISLMAFLGLRIGEAVSLRTKDVDIAGRRLWVSKTEKGSVPTMFFLHDQAYDALQRYFATQQPGKEWLFPAVKESNKFPHISPNWVRKEFREARSRAGLNFCYGYSEESRPGRRPRPLYRIVSHSCRHSFGHQVFDTCKDILVTQRLMRHKSIRNTQRYMYKGQEEIDSTLVRVFAKDY